MDQDRPPPPLPPPDPIPKPPDVYKPEEPKLYEKPAFIPKPLSHSPKISPSSIPNPSPSVSTSKVEGYPNYGNYLYSIPGYSAFQPITYPGILQPKPIVAKTELTSSDYTPFPKIAKKETNIEEKHIEIHKETNVNVTVDLTKPQTDFEDQFMPEIVPAVTSETKHVESKLNITSASQSSGATVTIPTSATNKDVKKKPPERFSLKTSIPISKIDMKCVTTAPDAIYQSPVSKKIPTPFNPAFHSVKSDRTEGPKVEIQSNIVIKTAPNTDNEIKVDNKPITTTASTNISTLINAAEAINKTDTHFRKPEPKPEPLTEIKDPAPTTAYAPPISNTIARPMFNPMNLETTKPNQNKPTEGNFAEQKNQILFIQNKNPSNPKMLLTIQQQNPQVMLQRTSFESKNLQAPSRLSSQMKKSKDDLVDNSSSKVVALKRLHQANCDENDFENLITENQIYGNKIVVKEKSQGTLQEQDLKNKNKQTDKLNQSESKSVVLQPNFLYLSNVQFPANLMMIKNNGKVNQINDNNMKPKIITSNENTVLKEVSSMTNNKEINSNFNNSNNKGQNIAINKDIHVLKSNNNVLQTISNNNNKADLLFQTSNQKVIMSPQIVYQVPMIVSDTDNKLGQQFVNRDYPKFLNQNKKEFPKQYDQTKQNEKLFIACPYQMDSKLQPKIVITNIRHKIAKVDEVSSLDVYEKRKRLRRLKYLTNRETKEGKEQKNDTKKFHEKIEHCKSIITPERMSAEIYKEFAKTKLMVNDDSSDSDCDYGEEELNEYDSIINKYGSSMEDNDGKAEFLANFRLANKEDYKDKDLDRQERILKRDSVASAYIAAGRLDCLTQEEYTADEEPSRPKEFLVSKNYDLHEKENVNNLAKKQTFLSQLMLVRVTAQYKEEYEKVWEEIVKERQRRDGSIDSEKVPVPKQEVKLNPDNQLQILTEIKNSVSENNNLIKKRLDSSEEANGDTIRMLAQKNFSELNRLSKMADLSVKLYSGPNTTKRDLNPGFESENIQNQSTKEQPNTKYPQINIPNISKIISLKSYQDHEAVSSSQATSMDEPKNSAAGVQEMFVQQTEIEKMQDFSCQVEETTSWPGIEAMIKSYKEFEAARKKEIAELHRRNTSLRVECAHTTRSASRDADRARALMAERRHLAAEEAAVRASIHRLCAAIEAVRNY